MNKKVVVVNCGRNGLGLIRSLGEKKVYDIIAVDHTKTPALFSKYVKEFFVLTDRIKNENQFIAELINSAGCTEGKPFLIPTNDEYVEIFINHMKELEKHFNLICFNSIFLDRKPPSQ